MPEVYVEPGRRNGVYAAFSAAMAMAGGLALVSGEDGLWVWVALVFGGIGAVILGWMALMPARLVLTSDGFSVSQRPVRAWSVPWSAIDPPFGVMSFGAYGSVSQLVVYNRSDDQRAMPSRMGRLLTRGSKRLTGFQESLPGNFGLEASELAELMNQRRLEAKRRA